MRYFIHLAYDGTHYCGWQVQLNAPSVQQTINEALQKLLCHDIKSMGCGRTDTGVHAKDFYMHFDTEREIEDKENFLFRLNCVLPTDITIFKIFQVHEKANTRFDATQRTYEYFVHFNKTSFVNKYSFFQGFYQINWQKIVEASEVLKKVSDFTALCLQSEDFKTNICKVTHASWDMLSHHHCILKPYNPNDAYPLLSDNLEHVFRGEECLRFTITSNRFLRGMVRKTVGSLLMVGKGKLSVAEFEDTVLNQKQFKTHYLAPPSGLFLSKVVYPASLLPKE